MGLWWCHHGVGLGWCHHGMGLGWCHIGVMSAHVMGGESRDSGEFHSMAAGKNHGLLATASHGVPDKGSISFEHNHY